MREGRRRRRRWAWGFLALLLTTCALMLYLRGAFAPEVGPRLVGMPASDAAGFMGAAAGFSGSLPTTGRATAFWAGGEAIYAARLAAIREASRSIRLETYAMSPGRQADAFAQALAERARSGVRVEFLADAHGAGEMPDDYWERLRTSGVEVRIFHPFTWSDPLQVLTRTHRKLLLVDTRHALIGGAGISDAWVPADAPPWRDFEVKVEGPLVELLDGAFAANWALAGPTVPLLPASGAVASPRTPNTMLTLGDFSLESSELRNLALACVASARRRLWIASPYFLPGDPMLDALVEARRRGVDVRILTMGPRTNYPWIRSASRELYGPLLAAGISLHEYQPAMMHAKAYLVDETWVAFGSANLDPLSFFQNSELLVTMQDASLVRHVEGFFLDSFAQSRTLTPAAWQKRPPLERARGWLTLQFRRIL